MIFFKLVASVLVVGTSAVFATAGVVIKRRIPPAGLKSPLEGYALVEPIFIGTILGQDYKIAGTAEQVYAKLEKIHGVDAVAGAVSAFKATLPAVRVNTTAGGETVWAREAYNHKRNKLPPPLCIPKAGGWPQPDWYCALQDGVFRVLPTTYAPIPVGSTFQPVVVLAWPATGILGFGCAMIDIPRLHLRPPI